MTFDVGSADLDAAVTRLASMGLRSLECHPPTLEELFLSHYRDELDANGVSNAGVVSEISAAAGRGHPT